MNNYFQISKNLFSILKSNKILETDYYRISTKHNPSLDLFKPGIIKKSEKHLNSVTFWDDEIAEGILVRKEPEYLVFISNGKELRWTLPYTQDSLENLINDQILILLLPHEESSIEYGLL